MYVWRQIGRLELDHGGLFQGVSGLVGGQGLVETGVEVGLAEFKGVERGTFR